MAFLGGVAHGGVGVDVVAVASAGALAFDVAGFDEVGDDALGGSFGDSDLFGDVAETDGGVALDAEEHLRVVGEEPPGFLVVWA